MSWLRCACRERTHAGYYWLRVAAYLEEVGVLKAEGVFGGQRRHAALERFQLLLHRLKVAEPTPLPTKGIECDQSRMPRPGRAERRRRNYPGPTRVTFSSTDAPRPKLPAWRHCNARRGDRSCTLSLRIPLPSERQTPKRPVMNASATSHACSTELLAANAPRAL